MKHMENNNHLCLLVCDQFGEETKAVIKADGFEDVTVRIYPHICENPQKRAKTLQKVMETIDVSLDQVILVGDCLLGNPDDLSKEVEHDHSGMCFYLLLEKEQVDQLIADGAYLLTPGWLRQWKDKIKSWGFDKPTARQFYKEFAKRLVLLDTGVDPDSKANLEAFSTFLDIPFEALQVGLGYYKLWLQKIISDTRLKHLQQLFENAIISANQRTADYAMALDLLAGMSRIMTEDEVIQQVLDLFQMMFASGRISYTIVKEGKLGDITARPELSPAITHRVAAFFKSGQEHTWDQENDTFYLRISDKDETVGILEMEEAYHSKNKQEYIDLSLSIARLCSLSIINARLYQETHRLSITDPLTGLFNRRYFFDMAEIEFKRSLRYHRNLSTLLLDIDFFKQINDTFGHLTGDSMLIHIAKICRDSVRAVDTWARYGGEEFILLLPETDSLCAIQLGERLRDSIASSPLEIDGKKITVTVSIGIASLDAHCPSISELLNRSDYALYQSKREGRNRVSLWR